MPPDELHLEVAMVRRALSLLLAVVGFGTMTWIEAAEGPSDVPVTATLKGHEDTVYAIAYSPDGRWIVTGSFDKTLRLWEAATGKPVRTLAGPNGHQGQVLALAFSADGRSVASGAADNTAKVWDVPNASPVRDYALPDVAHGVALSPDGSKLATAGKNGAVVVWNTGDGKQLATFSGHAGDVLSVAFSANGQLLASSGSDRTIRFWDVGKGQPVGVVGAHAGPALRVAIHPNNITAYSVGADGTLKVWQLPISAPLVAPPHDGAVTTLRLSANGAQFLSGSADKSVRLSNLANGQLVRRFEGAAAAVLSVAASKNGNYVAGGTADGKLLVWSAGDGKLLSQVAAHQGGTTAVQFTPQDQQLLTAGGDGRLRVWAVPPLPGRLLAHPDGVTAAVLSVDGKRLISGGADKTVRSWNLTTGQVERQYLGHTAGVAAVALSPDGKYLVSAEAAPVIRFWNQENGQPAEALGGHTGSITALAFHPSSQQLVSAAEDGLVKLWKLPLLPSRSLVHPDQVTAVSLSPDGTRLLTGCLDKQLRTWNLDKGQPERSWNTGSTITAVAYATVGGVAAAGLADKAILLVNPADGKELKKIDNLPAAVLAVTFSPEGKLAAAGLADHSIRLFDVTQGKEEKSLPGHTAPVSALAFAPKDNLLISASADKTVRIWNVVEGKATSTWTTAAPVASLAVSRDGARVVAGGDKSVQVWDLAQGKPTATLTLPAVVRSVAFTADGNQLVIGCEDHQVRVYGLDGRLRESFGHDGPVLAVAAHPDNTRVVSASADKTARIRGLALVWQVSHAGPVRQALFSPKGDRVYSAGDDRVIKAWAVADGKEVQAITGLMAPIRGLSLNGDGGRLAAVADKTLKVWNLAEGQPLLEQTLPAAADSVALSPNGSRVAVAFADAGAFPIRVIDVARGQELQSFSEHAAPVRALAFASDNRTLVSASLDRTARVQDVAVISAVEAHPGGVVAAEVLPSGAQALSAGADKQVKLWDLSNGKMVKSFGPVDTPITAAVASPDGQVAAVGSGKTVKLWNLSDGKELMTLPHPAEVVSLAWNADRSRIVTGGLDQVARVWDLATGKELEFYSHGGPVRAVLFHSNNAAIVTGTEDKAVTVHPIHALRVIAAATGPIRGLAVAPDGNPITASDDKSVVAWNVANGTALRSFAGATGGVAAVAVARNGAVLAAGGVDQVVRLYTVADAKPLLELKAPGAVTSLGFSPNNLALAAACADRSVVVWNVGYTPGQPPAADFGKVIQTFEHAAGATDVTFGPDNLGLVSSSLDKTAKAWRLASDAPTRNFPHPAIVDAVAIHPGGTLLATGCHDGVVRIYDLLKPQQGPRQINAHTQPTASPVYSVAWSPDGRQLVSASYDQTLKLWDANAGTLVREFKSYKEKEFEKGHREAVFAAVFSPDGKWLASGSSDQTVKLWNVADGQVVREFIPPEFAGPPPRSHPGWVYAVRFTADGRFLISGGTAPRRKGYLAIWNAADGSRVFAREIPLGPIHGLALSPDGQSVALACGGQGPTATEVPAYVIRLPSLK
ncbi:MAG: hypothetical protein NZ700_12585 [Gemmataceae bacterium]|nr:hypothetical protein [Gemmataceae bacterium]MDW8263939.1 hypothetical protein [Gemmataceae bacterium]